MSVRSLNKVTLIGNLTRDPELRYTPAGTAVCTFGLATNRSWTTQTGETKEETEFHRIVAWNKLGELCAQLLSKGRKTYLEGRLATHSWTGQDGSQRTTTEIVIEDMIILDSKKSFSESEGRGVDVAASKPIVEPTGADSIEQKKEDEVKEDKEKKEKPAEKAKAKTEDSSDKEVKEKEVEENSNQSEDITPDDIPF